MWCSSRPLRADQRALGIKTRPEGQPWLVIGGWELPSLLVAVYSLRHQRVEVRTVSRKNSWQNIEKGCGRCDMMGLNGGMAVQWGEGI